MTETSAGLTDQRFFYVCNNSIKVLRYVDNDRIFIISNLVPLTWQIDCRAERRA